MAHWAVTQDNPHALVHAVEDLVAAGAGNVVVSRAEKAALGLLESELVEIVPPRLHAIDHRGAGDSMTAGIAVGLARHIGLLGAVRLGAAAGALNVTRHGLGSGDREEIERLAEHVVIRPARVE